MRKETLEKFLIDVKRGAAGWLAEVRAMPRERRQLLYFISVGVLVIYFTSVETWYSSGKADGEESVIDALQAVSQAAVREIQDACSSRWRSEECRHFRALRRGDDSIR